MKINQWLSRKITIRRFWEDETAEELANAILYGNRELQLICSGYDAIFDNKDGTLYCYLAQFSQDIVSMPFFDYHVFGAFIAKSWTILHSWCQSYRSLLSMLVNNVKQRSYGEIQEILEVPTFRILSHLSKIERQELFTWIMQIAPNRYGEAVCGLMEATIKENLRRFFPAVLEELDYMDDIVMSEEVATEFVQRFMGPLNLIVLTLEAFLNLPEEHWEFLGLSASADHVMGNRSKAFLFSLFVTRTAEVIAKNESLVLGDLGMELLGLPLAIVLKFRGKTIPQIISEDFKAPEAALFVEVIALVAKDVADGKLITDQVIVEMLNNLTSIREKSNSNIALD
jgi:hypothetical protein